MKDTIYSRFRKVADAQPDEIAIREDGRTVTYSQLDRLVDALISHRADRTRYAIVETKHVIMNIDEFREYCLSMPGTSDKMPWKQKQYENLLVFSIGDKWFCFVDIEKFKFCDLKCNPEKSSELQASYSGIKPGWHMNHRNWISVYFNSDVPDNLIRQLVKESYENVFDSLTKKKRGNIEIEE